MSSLTYPSSLRDLSYFKTGGECLGIFAPSSTEELQDILRHQIPAHQPVFFLGGGSNSLISDDFFPGYVISSQRLSSLRFKPPHTLHGGSGVLNSDVVSYALTHQLKGVAWLSGLPGQLGGTTRMNARCYGSEIADIIYHITTVSRSGQIHHYPKPSHLFYGYKDTYFMKAEEFITEISFRLSMADPPSLLKEKQLGEFCQTDRTSKGQYLYPSCGCVFKNHYSIGVPSGLLLDLAGLKNHTLGGAQVSGFHGNFIYNRHGTSEDIFQLSTFMREEVYRVFGVWLDYEMEFLGQFSSHIQKLRSEKKTTQRSVDQEKSLLEAKNIFACNRKKPA